MQVALLVAPLLVFISLAAGNPMSLVFNPFEIAALAASVIIAALIALDGESNWLEGAQLIIVYVIEVLEADAALAVKILLWVVLREMGLGTLLCDLLTDEELEGVLLGGVSRRYQSHTKDRRKLLIAGSEVHLPLADHVDRHHQRLTLWQRVAHRQRPGRLASRHPGGTPGVS